MWWPYLSIFAALIFGLFGVYTEGNKKYKKAIRLVAAISIMVSCTITFFQTCKSESDKEQAGKRTIRIKNLVYDKIESTCNKYVALYYTALPDSGIKLPRNSINIIAYLRSLDFIIPMMQLIQKNDPTLDIVIHEFSNIGDELHSIGTQYQNYIDAEDLLLIDKVRNHPYPTMLQSSIILSKHHTQTNESDGVFLAHQDFYGNLYDLIMTCEQQSK